MPRYRSFDVAFKRQVAQEFLTGEGRHRRPDLDRRERRQGSSGSRRTGDRSRPARDDCRARGYDGERRRQDGARHAWRHERSTAHARRPIAARIDKVL
jgi:hypothetical protein